MSTACLTRSLLSNEPLDTASSRVAIAAKSISRPLATVRQIRLSAEKKETGPICAKHPMGRSGNLDLSPFSPLVVPPGL